MAMTEVGDPLPSIMSERSQELSCHLDSLYLENQHEEMIWTVNTEMRDCLLNDNWSVRTMWWVISVVSNMGLFVVGL